LRGENGEERRKDRAAKDGEAGSGEDGGQGKETDPSKLYARGPLTTVTHKTCCLN